MDVVVELGERVVSGMDSGLVGVSREAFCRAERGDGRLDRASGDDRGVLCWCCANSDGDSECILRLANTIWRGCEGWTRYRAVVARKRESERWKRDKGEERRLR